MSIAEGVGNKLCSMKGGMYDRYMDSQFSHGAQSHRTSGNLYSHSVLFHCVLLFFIPFCTACVLVIPF